MKIKEEGQSLVEMLLAFFIMSLVVIAVVGLSTASVRNATQAKNNTMARRYAEEGMEWLRGKRDLAWNNFYSHAKNPNSQSDNKGIYCMITFVDAEIKWSNIESQPCNTDTTDPEVVIDNTVNNQGLFYRQLNIVRHDTDINIVYANVSVWWTDAKGTHEVVLDSEFTNWNR